VGDGSRRKEPALPDLTAPIGVCVQAQGRRARELPDCTDDRCQPRRRHRHRASRSRRSSGAFGLGAVTVALGQAAPEVWNAVLGA